MKWCKQWLIPAMVVLAVVVFPAFGYAQGAGTSSITGTVTDNSGGVIPGATVTATDASGVKYETVSNSQGAFTIPSITPGTYKVTVTLQGFKTYVAENVRVVSGNPAAVSAKLEIGQLSETVTVRSATELVNTQNATVSSTLNADQLNRMPTASRNALNAVTFLPGVNVATTNRGANVNGLPQSMLNITLDGVSNQDNFNKSTDGFFASVYPRQDAIESVTVTSAVSGANLGGSGAVTIAFTTRSGTNRLSGSAYEFYRRPDLNTNNWVNERNGLGKNQTKLDQYGSRVGGPIKIPGLYDGSGKAFFFFHYEELRFPNSFTRTRTIMNPATLDGTFFYNVTNAGVTTTQSVNVLQIAGGTIDPQTLQLLNQINASAHTTGVISNSTNPNIFNYTYQSPAELLERQPTGRIDYNISSAHRLSVTASSLWASRTPDYLNSLESRFPGAPNFTNFASTRPLYSFALRSTLSSNMVNSINSGFTAYGSAGSRFGQPTDASYAASAWADMGGNAVVIPFTTDWWTDRQPSWRAAPTWNIDDSLSWQKGNHSFNFGGSFLHSASWASDQTVVPQMTLGMSSATCIGPLGSAPCDPAFGLFTNATTPVPGTVPGASNGNLTDARNHYAQLTGRIVSINGQLTLDPGTNQYNYLGPRTREGYLNVTSLFMQDSWRMTPTVTLSAGARWDYQAPFVSINDTMSAASFASVCGLSGPGLGTTAFNKCNFNSRITANTAVPELIQFSKGTKGYNDDWNNVAPNVSLAWRPNVQSGFMRKILGDPEQATLRGGYSVSYERQGIGVFTGVYGSNNGSAVTLNRNVGNANLVYTGETWPLLYSQKDRLGPPVFDSAVHYPIAGNTSDWMTTGARPNSLNAFAPDTKIASARSWTVGFQRSISRDMAAEVRYVGTRGIDQWSRLNYNTRDLQSNGFVNEFRNAIENLRVNNIAGGSRAGSFAYFGAGTGTSPLPIYLAYINALPASAATLTSSYSGTTWTSTAFTGDMAFTNPSIGNSAGDLDGSGTNRVNAITAGLPANFFVLNPAMNVVNVTDSGAFSDYNAMQLELRRRLSKGLSASASYQYALEGGSGFDGFAYGRQMDPSANVRHAIKTQWDWQLPIGRGQRVGTNWNSWMDGALGGWSFNGVGRFQTRMFDLGNVRVIGMTHQDVQNLFKLRRVKDPAINSGLETVFSMPDDVILNTRRAFNTSSSSLDGYGTLGPPTGRYFAPADSQSCIELIAGQCGTRNLLVRGPWFVRLDVGLNKRFSLKGRSSAEVAIQVLNLLDNINFTPAANPGSSATQFQTTTIYMDANNTYDPGGRLGQLMFRINW